MTGGWTNGMSVMQAASETVGPDLPMVETNNHSEAVDLMGRDSRWKMEGFRGILSRARQQVTCGCLRQCTPFVPGDGRYAAKISAVSSDGCS